MSSTGTLSEASCGPSGSDLTFHSDNTAAVSAPIMAAILAANEGVASSYGNDDHTRGAQRAIAALFEADCAVFPVATGTAANALALAAVTPSWGAVFCHRSAHINVDECGAPEFYSGGGKLVLLDGEDGKISAAALEHAIQDADVGDVHRVQPAAVSITQATERGAVYQPEEIRAIAQVAHDHGLYLHLDGARLANALVRQGLSPADGSWRLGVDLLSFGATKNGAMAAEAVVIFDPKLVAGFDYRHKRGGHLWSKMRFLGAQLEAYVSNDHWLENATHANAMAARLSQGLAALPGAELVHPTEANEVFIALPAAALARLNEHGADLQTGHDGRTIRLVTAFNTAPEAVDRFIELAEEPGPSST